MQENLAEAERRIEEARRTQAESLDLGVLALSEAYLLVSRRLVSGIHQHFSALSMGDDMSPPDPRDANDKPIGFVLGGGGALGWILRKLRRFPRFAIALGQRSLYHVRMEGSGFELPVEGGRNITGFFINRVVAAQTRAEAESKAIAIVLREWQGLSLFSYMTGVDEPRMVIAESHPIEGWFCRRGDGFIFFSDDEGQDISEDG